MDIENILQGVSLIAIALGVLVTLDGVLQAVLKDQIKTRKEGKQSGADIDHAKAVSSAAALRDIMAEATLIKSPKKFKNTPKKKHKSGRKPTGRIAAPRNAQGQYMKVSR